MRLRARNLTRGSIIVVTLWSSLMLRVFSLVVSPVHMKDVGSPRELESSTATSQASGLDLSSLDAKMQEIEDSLQEMDISGSATPTPAVAVSPEDDDEDSDSEDEDEGGMSQGHLLFAWLYIVRVCVCAIDAGMRIGARALYGYEARSDKELTFGQGDALQVITKTPDNNWWDGFHSGRRGFIPVAYVEITELKTSPSPPPPPLSPSSSAAVLSALPVPAPPQRKSSIPIPAEEEAALKLQPSIMEEDEGEAAEQEELPPHQDPLDVDKPEETEPSSPPPSLQVTNEQPEEATTLLKSPSDVTSPSTNFPVKSVRSLTKQFQEPEPPSQQPKVLVEPHTHRRHGSDQFKVISEPPPGSVSPPRSASGGSRVGMLSSTFNKKVAIATAPPPPTRPKPPSLVHVVPTSPTAEVFPLRQHPTATGVPGVSPLQQAAHQSLHKPAVLGKKPAAQALKTAGNRKSGSIKGKKKDGGKDKEKNKSSKPVLTPKPAAFVATPEEIQAQLQAARAKRKHNEDKL